MDITPDQRGGGDVHAGKDGNALDGSKIYTVCQYEPSKAIIDGSWTFPSPPTPRKD